MVLDHHAHLLVTGHHDFAHAVAGISDIHPRFVHLPRQVEEPVPGVRALLASRALLPVHHLIKPARADPVEQRPEGSRLRIVQMRQEHGLGIPVPDLLRTHIYRLSLRIDVQKELGRVLNSRGRCQRVPAPDQREKSDSVQLKQEGTGHAEEVAHHKIRSPRCGQFGKAVEYIERVEAFLGDQVVDGHRKSLEPVGQLNMNRFDLRASLR